MLMFLLSLLVQYASFVGTVAAVHDEGIFELDGNALDQGGVDGDDWEDGTAGAADDLFIPGSVEKDGADTSYFKEGGSKDHHDLDDWKWSGTDVAPDKDELLDVFAAVYEAGETRVYFGADKFDDSGDAQIGFWFFQDKVSLDGDGTFNGLHTVGDVLVLSDFTNGGEVDLICVYEWNPPGDDIANGVSDETGCDVGDNVTLVAAGAECDVSSPDGEFDVCAVVNNGDETAPWAFENKDGDDFFAKGQFFEGGINLSQLFGGDAPCFSTFLAETRSSQEVEAQLKDFALGSLDTCVPPDIETDASVDDADFGDEVTDTATLSGDHGEVKGAIKFFICEPDEVTSGGCEGDAGTLVSTETIVNEQAESDPYTVGLTEDAVGTYCWRAEYTPAADSEYLAGSHTDNDRECFDVAPAKVEVEKEADNASVNAGEQIGFTVTITNTGDNTALGVELSDALPGGAGVDWSIQSQSGGFSISGSPQSESLEFGPTSLAAGESATVHVVSNTTGLSCGEYENTAAVSSTNDGSDESTATTEVRCAQIDVAKEADDASVEAGEQIGFTVTISNNGTGLATGLTFLDALPGGDGIDWSIESQSGGFSITGTAPNQSLAFAPTTLAAGASAWVHVVSATTADSCGQYDNTASVDTTNDGEDEASDSTFVECPALDIVKDDAGATYDEVGDVIHYSIVATNIGNVTLHDVVVTDPNAVNLVCVPALPVAELDPGDEINCTAEHVVTQDDLDAGSYLNTACVDDGSGDGDTGADEACDDEDTPGDQNPALDIVKTDGDATYSAVGDVIHYSITATNTGNVTLHDVVITDPNAVNLVCVPALPVADLEPGDEINCTAEHVVTQEDLDNGSYLNTACVDDEMGEPESGADEACDDEDTPGEQNPELDIVKDDAGATYDEVGDVINYTIVATNTGNVTLHDVVITDPNAVNLVCTPALPVADLAPSDEISCTAEHTVTQADIDAGSYLNTACVDDGNGDGDTGADEDCDDENTPGSQNPELAIVKDDAGATYDEVGDVIHYTIVATNIGNVTLKGVVVTDPNVTDLDCTPDTPVDLAPGDSIECTASHTVTQEDLDNGVYLNTACANDTDGPAAEVCDDEDTPGEQNPALAIDKSVAESLFDEVGQVLHYTIVVTNVGNVTLHNVVVTDPLVSDLDCEPDLPVASLAVGASFTCTATYTIVEADFDPLVVTNVACADDGLGDGEVGADPVCDTVQTPGQELEEETDAPTQPPTDAVSGSNNSAPGGGAWLLVIGLAIALSALVFVTPARKRSQR
jgi:uncharacterized repeat protein (TIGR01451 family)